MSCCSENEAVVAAIAVRVRARVRLCSSQARVVSVHPAHEYTCASFLAPRVQAACGIALFSSARFCLQVGAKVLALPKE